jgi:predicted nuclease with TOPRIM domain
MESPKKDNSYDVPVQKDNRKLIYGFLLAALVGTWGYIFYDKSQNRQAVTTLETRISSLDSARAAVQQDFMEVSAKADSLTQTTVQLTGDLAAKNAYIVQLKGNISSILKKKNATEYELTAAKNLIGELNGKVDGLFAEIEKLKGENKELTAANQQLSTEKTQLTTEKQNLEQNLIVTKTEKKQLEDKVDVASTLHASQIGIGAFAISKSGKEKETTTAKKADLIRVQFVLDENRVTPSGNKELYVIVTGPDGKVISEGNNTFTTREEGVKTFTNKLGVNYAQGKIVPVNFDLKKTDQYMEGNYTIEIYHNGFRIGKGVKTLQKGGLFG